MKKFNRKRKQSSKFADFTHIYSFNKVMGKKWLQEIAKVLNRTNFKILVWYFNESSTLKLGVKCIKLIDQVAMRSTGGETFTAYIYAKVLENNTK